MDADKIVDLAKEWADAAAKAIGTYGPDVARLAEQIARLDAISWLVVPTVVGGAAIVGLVQGPSWYRYFRSRKKEIITEERGYSGDCAPMELGMFASAVGTGFSALLLMGSALRLLNPIVWAGIIEPKIWIVAKILKLI